MNRTITQLVNLLRTFADELENGLTETTETATPAKRGRPRKEPEATTTSEPAQVVQPPVEEPKGMPLDDLKALIDEPVKDGQGKQVKDLIAKHGGTKLSDLPAENHAAFAADIEGMVY